MKTIRGVAAAALIVASALASHAALAQPGIPAGTIHAAKNVGTGNAAELATYIIEKGKPALTLAE